LTIKYLQGDSGSDEEDFSAFKTPGGAQAFVQPASEVPFPAEFTTLLFNMLSGSKQTVLCRAHRRMK